MRRATILLAGCLPVAYLTQAATPSLTTVYSFTDQNGDGAYPYTGIILSSAGIIYGTTEYGGIAGMGTIFELTPNGSSWTESVIHSFNGSDGSYPYAGVIIDSSGNLYGTTTYGGAWGLGTVFELTPPGTQGGAWTLKTVYNFSGSDGANPYAPLLLGSGGSLFGTTELGGASYAGTVFKLKPQGGAWTESVLYSFSGGADGGFPYGGLALGKNNVLYGTTNFGGSSTYGTVFQLVPSASSGPWTLTTIHSFNGSGDSGNPFANLVLDSKGALYGTTAGGIGCGYGTVFKLSPPGTTGAWTETVLYRFSGGSDGGHPRGSVNLAKSGAIYGTAFAGGSANSYSGWGLIFQLTPGTPYTETVLHTFSGGTDGGYPNGLLAPAANGSYYGTTLVGGTLGYGLVFNLVP